MSRRAWTVAVAPMCASHAIAPAAARAGQHSLDLPRAVDEKVVRLAHDAFKAMGAGRALEAAGSGCSRQGSRVLTQRRKCRTP
jgi:hypothetical protein